MKNTGTYIFRMTLILACLVNIAAYAGEQTSGKKKNVDELTNNIIPRIVVGYVFKDGVGDKTGIKAGDTLVAVAGKQIQDVATAINEIKAAGNEFEMKLASSDGEKVIAVKRQQDERLGVKFLEQLPANRMPFGYILKWYDGVVLDLFSGKLKQAEIVLNPYSLAKETSKTIKSKDGEDIAGNTIPCGGKFVYKDSQGRLFSVVNELISLPTEKWSMEDLEKTAQWPLLKLQPFMAILAKEEGEQRNQQIQVAQANKEKEQENKAQEQEKKAAEEKMAQAAAEKEKIYAQFRTGDVANATAIASQMKGNNKLVVKNLYVGMPLKNAVAVIENLLGEKLDLRGSSESGYQLGRYRDKSALKAQLEQAAAMSTALGAADFRVDGTIVSADKEGNCVEFSFGRRDLVKIFQTPELSGVEFFKEFCKNYEVVVGTSLYIPKLEDLVYTQSINLGYRKRYEVLDPRGAKLSFFQHEFGDDEKRQQAGMLGLENEMLIITGTASAGERKKKFD